MNNFFNNVNLKVKEQKIFHSSACPDTSMIKLYKDKCNDRENELRIKSVEAKMESARKMEIQANISAGQSLESYLINVSNQLYKEGKEIIFRDIMGDIYLESVYLDNDFKEQYADSIKSTMNEYIDKNGGFAMLEAACKKEGTKLLCDMKEVVEKTARKCSMRKINELKEACGSKASEACKTKEACGSKASEACKTKEACGSKASEACKTKEACGSKASEACKTKEACTSQRGKGAKAMEIMNQTHCFDMNKKEIEEYRQEREKLSEEEIVELVRDKVLTVIKDEQNRQSDIERFEEEIEQKAQELDASDKQKEAFKESAIRLSSTNTFTDMTLFEAIQVSTMKEMMESTNKCESKDKEDELFDKEFDDLCDGDEDCDQIDMDLVLAESITKYTLLEVCNTMRLERFTRNNVQQLCLNLTK